MTVVLKLTWSDYQGLKIAATPTVNAMCYLSNWRQPGRFGRKKCERIIIIIIIIICYLQLGSHPVAAVCYTYYI